MTVIPDNLGPVELGVAVGVTVAVAVAVAVAVGVGVGERVATGEGVGVGTGVAALLSTLKVPLVDRVKASITPDVTNEVKSTVDVVMQYWISVPAD